MAEETKFEFTPVQSRRAFVKTAAKVAVTAPAAAMLLNASIKPAKASTEPYVDTTGADDYTVTGDDGLSDDIVFNPGDLITF